tara:strand:- start:23912 stop:25570 length:1659 start_codon:yes stop_codon:yes gene_type:complete
MALPLLSFGGRMLMGGGRGALRFGKGAAKGVGVAGLGAIGGGAAGLASQGGGSGITMGNQGPLAAASGGAGFSSAATPMTSAAGATSVLSDADSSDPVVRQLQDIERVLVDIRVNTSTLGTGTGASSAMPMNSNAMESMFGNNRLAPKAAGIGLAGAALLGLTGSDKKEGEIEGKEDKEPGWLEKTENVFEEFGAEITGAMKGLQEALTKNTTALKPPVKPTPTARPSVATKPTIDTTGRPSGGPRPVFNAAANRYQDMNDPNRRFMKTADAEKILKGSAKQATAEVIEETTEAGARTLAQRTGDVVKEGAKGTLKTAAKVVAPAAAIYETGADFKENEDKLKAIEAAFKRGDISQEDFDKAQDAMFANRAGSVGRGTGAFLGGLGAAKATAAAASPMLAAGPFGVLAYALTVIGAGATGSIVGSKLGDSAATKATEELMSLDPESQAILDNLAEASGYTPEPGLIDKAIDAGASLADSASQLVSGSDDIETATTEASKQDQPATVNNIVDNSTTTNGGNNQGQIMHIGPNQLDVIEQAMIGRNFRTTLGPY